MNNFNNNFYPHQILITAILKKTCFKNYWIMINIVIKIIRIGRKGYILFD